VNYYVRHVKPYLACAHIGYAGVGQAGLHEGCHALAAKLPAPETQTVVLAARATLPPRDPWASAAEVVAGCHVQGPRVRVQRWAAMVAAGRQAPRDGGGDGREHGRL
jgi:hypothetical protein